MPYIIGVTGGIGSGKSAVSDHFHSLGIDVVDADLAARAVVARGSSGLAAIVEHFGKRFLLPDGTLDRAELRAAVFTDPNKRHWLEQLTHPLIREEIRRGLEATTSPYALLVSPLLVESSQQQLVNRVLVVDVPENLQLARTVARDGNSIEQVKSIMAAQASREVRLASADDVIVNDGTLASLQEKVELLHQNYLQMAAAGNAAAEGNAS